MKGTRVKLRPGVRQEHCATLLKDENLGTVVHTMCQDHTVCVLFDGDPSGKRYVPRSYVVPTRDLTPPPEAPPPEARPAAPSQKVQVVAMLQTAGIPFVEAPSADPARGCVVTCRGGRADNVEFHFDARGALLDLYGGL
jgi:hypothetical protein